MGVTAAGPRIMVVAVAFMFDVLVNAMRILWHWMQAQGPSTFLIGASGFLLASPLAFVLTCGHQLGSPGLCFDLPENLIGVTICLLILIALAGAALAGGGRKLAGRGSISCTSQYQPGFIEVCKASKVIRELQQQGPSEMPTKVFS